MFFIRVAQQLVGKSVVLLLRSSGIPREIVAILLQKYTLAIAVTQKSLTQRNVSFRVNRRILFLMTLALLAPQLLLCLQVHWYHWQVQNRPLMFH